LQENAQILYGHGDKEGAWSELQQFCTLFDDRVGMNRPYCRVEELGLVKPATRCEPDTPAL